MRHRNTVLATLLVVAFGGGVTLALAQRATPSPAAPASDGWEYLVVAGGTTNLTPTSNSSLRKEPSGAFREGFVVEQNLDKLGAKGWELVSVSGPSVDPVYYFKRKK